MDAPWYLICVPVITGNQTCEEEVVGTIPRSERDATPTLLKRIFILSETFAGSYIPYVEYFWYISSFAYLLDT